MKSFKKFKKELKKGKLIKESKTIIDNSFTDKIIDFLNVDDHEEEIFINDKEYIYCSNFDTLSVVYINLKTDDEFDTLYIDDYQSMSNEDIIKKIYKYLDKFTITPKKIEVNDDVEDITKDISTINHTFFIDDYDIAFNFFNDSSIEKDECFTYYEHPENAHKTGFHKTYSVKDEDFKVIIEHKFSTISSLHRDNNDKIDLSLIKYKDDFFIARLFGKSNWDTDKSGKNIRNNKYKMKKLDNEKQFYDIIENLKGQHILFIYYNDGSCLDVCINPDKYIKYVMFPTSDLSGFYGISKNVALKILKDPEENIKILSDYYNTHKK